jgi:hypothetical protein
MRLPARSGDLVRFFRASFVRDNAQLAGRTVRGHTVSKARHYKSDL